VIFYAGVVCNDIVRFKSVCAVYIDRVCMGRVWMDLVHIRPVCFSVPVVKIVIRVTVRIVIMFVMGIVIEIVTSLLVG
jgi:hypothetical protein